MTYDQLEREDNGAVAPKYMRYTTYKLSLGSVLEASGLVGRNMSFFAHLLAYLCKYIQSSLNFFHLPYHMLPFTHILWSTEYHMRTRP